MKFNLYSTLWMDPAFYIAAGVFALALFLLVFSIRKYLEIKNGSDFEEPGDRAEEIQGELPLTAVDVTREPAVAQDAAAAALRVEAQAESPASSARRAAGPPRQPAAGRAPGAPRASPPSRRICERTLPEHVQPRRQAEKYRGGFFKDEREP